MSEALCFLSIAEAGERIRSRAITPVALTNAYLDRIAAIDPQLNAYITVTADVAQRQAHEAETEIARGAYRGPLHGIPFGLKDMFDTRGILTTAHSKVLAHNIPDHDANVVTKLYAAGAV